MNVAYYVLMFDEATDVYKDQVGIDRDYRVRTNCTTFAAELHITYLAELRLDDVVQVETLLLDADDKRHHFIHQMFKRSGPANDDSATVSDSACATMEVMSMHIDLAVRRPSPFPGDVNQNIQTLLGKHAELERPAQTGSIIGLQRKKS